MLVEGPNIKDNYLLELNDIILAKKIASKIGLPTVYIGTNELKNTKKNLNHNKVLFNQFDNDFQEKAQPLDKELLKELVRFERIYLKIIGRLKFNTICYDERLQIYFEQVRFWNWIIDYYKIKLSIFFNIPHQGYDFIIYSLCKVKGIKTIASYRLPTVPYIFYKRYFISDIFNHSSSNKLENKNYNFKENINISDLEKSFQDLYLSIYPKDKSKKKTIVPKWVKDGRISIEKKYNIFDNIKLGLISLKDYGFISTLEKISRRIIFLQKLIYRNPYLAPINKVNKAIDKISNNFIPSSDYVFYAIHYEPELSTAPLGDFYFDQNLVVDMLAWVLKKYNIILVIKRHPRKDKRFYLRNKNFYNQMNKHDNVFFISSKYNTTKLIEHSIAVASITGSVCWESYLRRKPSIIFGTTIYENQKGIRKIETKKDLENAIEDIINKRIIINDKDILNYLKSIQDITFDFAMKNIHKNTPFSKEEGYDNYVRKLQDYIFNHY